MDRELIRKMNKLLCKQIESYADVSNLGGKALEDVANLVKTVKNLSIIEGMEEEKQGGASMRGYAYDDGASMRRGQDSMGRFVSRDDGSMRGGSYHDGMEESEDMKRALQEIKRKLDQMM